MREEGYIDEVTVVRAHTFLVENAAAQSLTLIVEDATDFEEDGGVLLVNGTEVEYRSVDYDTDTISLREPLATAVAMENEVSPVPDSIYHEAAVITSEDDEPIAAVVHHTLIDRLPEGIREDVMEPVAIELVGDTWYVVDILNRQPNIDGSFLTPDTVTVEALSPEVLDGIGQADGVTTYAGPQEPADAVEGDLWLDTTGGINVLKQLVDGVWLAVNDPDVQEAIEAAQAAAELADSKMRIFYQDEPPTGMTPDDLGDLWFDTNDGNRPYRYTGNGPVSGWVTIRDTTIDTAQQSANQALQTANGKNTVVFSTSAPSGTSYSNGDLWYRRDANGVVIGFWEFRTGAWVTRQFSDATLTSLTVGKLTGGTISAADIIIGTNGVLRSANYSANTNGYRLSNTGFEMNSGIIRGVETYSGYFSTSPSFDTTDSVELTGKYVYFWHGSSGPGSITSFAEGGTTGYPGLLIGSGSAGGSGATQSSIRLVGGATGASPEVSISAAVTSLTGRLSTSRIDAPSAVLQLKTSNANLSIRGGSNIVGQIGTDFGSGGSGLTFIGATMGAGTQGMNGTSFIASNTVPFYANGFFATELTGSTTTGASINSNGRIIRTSSSRRYKSNIKPLTLTQAKVALDLEAVTFTLREESGMGEQRARYPGFIAEQAHDAGMSHWVNYNTDGEPEGFRYAELTAAHNVLIKDLTEKNKALEARVASLETLLGAQ